MSIPARSSPSARSRMAAPRLWRCALLLAAALATPAIADKPLPKRNLLIELRDAQASSATAGNSGWNVRSADASAARERPAQQLRVLNGSSASLNLTVTRPLTVWQVTPGAVLSVPVPTTQWLEAGQRLTLQPRWTGGSEPVEVMLSADSSRFDGAVAPGSAEAPQRNDARVVTTVRAPLAQWVTLATSGAADDNANVISSGQAAASARRVLQLRVSLAP